MTSKRLGLIVLVAVVVGLCSPAPVEAGIMDSIKGFFSKASDTVKGWFSGGGTKEFEEMLTKVVASQEVVAEKQSAVYDTLTTGNLNDSNDPTFQAQMDELSTASRENEQLYLQLLQVRQELADGKKDLSKYQESIDRIQETQHNLEEGYQAIQDKTREIGGFTPPADVMASAGGAGGEGPLWADPRVQGFIDEWLAANGLNKFGVLEGGVVVMSADPDRDNKPLHQYLWENLAGQSGRVTGMTLEQYVMSRLDGGAAAVPAAGAVDSGVAGSSGGATDDSITVGSSDVGAVPDTSHITVETDGTNADLERRLKEAMTAYQQLSAAGMGQSEEANRILGVIKSLKQTRDNRIKAGVQAAN